VKLNDFMVFNAMNWQKECIHGHGQDFPGSTGLLLKQNSPIKIWRKWQNLNLLSNELTKAETMIMATINRVVFSTVESLYGNL